MIAEIVISVSAVDSANVFGVTSAGRLAKFDFEANSWVFKGASPNIIDIYAANNSKGASPVIIDIYAANNSKKGEEPKKIEVEKEVLSSFLKTAKKVVKKKTKSK